MPADYFEICFTIPSSNYSAEDLLIQALKSLGIARGQIVQRVDADNRFILIYFDQRTKLQRFLRAYAKTALPRVRLKQRFISYSNWAEKWKDDYRIQPIGKKFVLIPAWRQREFKNTRYEGRVPVIINPLSAFGSGEHETTQLMTRMMEMLQGKFESFLDAGTGTGILSIFAAYLGSSKIFGFDCDKPSARCAQFNFEMNLGKLAQAEFKCLELARLNHGKFDLVAANINSHILENYRRQLVSSAKKKGWVLLSGILGQTYDSFRENFDGPDLRCVKIMRGRRWIAVLYRKIR